MFPEMLRVLKYGGVLQLMFKPGKAALGSLTRIMALPREFNLFEEKRIVEALEELGMKLVEGEPERLGGLIRYTDRKNVLNCVIYLRRGRA